jgi:hypothetical protein
MMGDVHFGSGFFPIPDPGIRGSKTNRIPDQAINKHLTTYWCGGVKIISHSVSPGIFVQESRYWY